ncbi:HAD family hydrolase [Flexithrix dorotheae]|uniref:HAD family hydrolase n=1 Tax=Flexithrix dorotheae TaxID=70993 RepID=UPI00036A64A6|nr:HAD family hydrolase [Flexithrix dorotheae]
MNNLKLVILDIDETLVHSTRNPPHENWDFELFDFKVYKRPFLSDFLFFLKDHFKVAVWSSASDDYVEAISKIIFPSDYPLEFIWGREKCTFKLDYSKVDDSGYLDYYEHYNYVKQLSKVKKQFKIPLETILIIDDSPHKCIQNYGNAIYPIPFEGYKNDKELLLLQKYLLKFKAVSNVRNIEKRFWRSEI